MVKNSKNNLYLFLGLFLFIMQNNIYADSNVCNYQNNNLDSEIRKYKIRINGFMDKNKNTTCDILYGYNKILNNEDLMNKFEDNPSDFQQFSEFIRNYPKLSQFINNYEEFHYFNKISSKDIIEKIITKVNLGNNKKSNLVFWMALSFQSLNYINEKILENDLNEINNYSEKDIEFIIPFWNVYNNFYSESKHMMKYKEFSKIIKEITISTLKEYSHRQEFFIYFLSDKNNHLEYTKTIKLLLDKKEVKEKYLLNFIEQISFDINDAIEKGYKAKDIVSYLNPFISDKILMKSFYKSSCSGSDNKNDDIESAIISQSLSEKISFKKDNNEIFSEIIKSLKNKIEESDKIIMLSYYNLMLRIYNELENKEQKNVLIDLYKNLTNDKTFNMRAITVLYQYTDYFADIINKNWKNKEYRGILYIEQSGNSSLKYLKETTPESVESLNKIVYTLIRTPKENLNDLTSKEIFDKTLEVADKASYATLIIPGAGIAVNVAKELAKQSVKQITKQVIKQGAKKTSEKTEKAFKNTANEYLKNRIKYGDGRRKLSKNINNFQKKADMVDITVSIGSIIMYGLYNHYFEEKKQKSICGEEN